MIYQKRIMFLIYIQDSLESSIDTEWIILVK